MEQKRISETGRAALADAVAQDRDWNLRASAEDQLIAALSALGDDDLEAAATAVHILTEAVTCALVRRDTLKLEAARVEAQRCPECGLNPIADGYAVCEVYALTDLVPR